MANRLQELELRKTEAAGKIKSLRDAIANDNREFTPEERASWEACNKDFDAAKAAIEVEKRAIEIEKSDTEVRVGRESFDGRKAEAKTAGPDEDTRARALRSWFRAANGGELTEAEVAACKACNINPRSRELEIRTDRTLNDIQRNWRRMSSHPHEFRATMQTFDVAAGGALIAPQFSNTLEINMLAFGGVRQAATLVQTSQGGTLTMPTFDDTANSGAIAAESATIDNSGAGGNNPTTGALTWSDYKYGSGTILVPTELLEDSAFNLESIINAALGERLGRKTNDDFTTGNGVGKPRGIVTCASLGVTSGATTTFDFDDLLELEHSVDPAYRQGAAYMFHDTTALYMRKLKYSDGRYIWDDATDTVNRRPYFINQSMSSTFTTGQKLVLFGQLSKYYIRRVGGIRFVRMVERYRDVDKDGFVALVREDGNLVNAGTAPVKYLALA